MKGHFLLAGVLFLFACGSSKKLKDQKIDGLQPFTLKMVENYKLDTALISQVQFFSGPDTIILAKELEIASGRVDKDGTVILTGGNPTKSAIILPNTPGVLGANGIVMERGIIKELLIVYSDNPKDVLTYVPSSDTLETFVLDSLQTMRAGAGSTLMFSLLYSEQSDMNKIEPGRKVADPLRPTVNQLPNKIFLKKKN